MQRIFREALFYGLAFGLVVLGTSAASFWLLRSSYVGVTDDGVVQAGVAAHAAYLGSVGAAAARLLAMEILALSTLSFGLLVLVRAARGARTTDGLVSGPPLRWPWFIGVACLVHLAWFGAQARRHPGLFLGLLSSSPIGPLWVSLSRVLWPALLAASIAGWLRLIVAARFMGVRVFAAGGCLFALAWFWFLETSPPAPRAPSSRAAGGPSDSGARLSKPFPNILLIGVDSLRPDKIDAQSTPALARLCRESIYFPNALVTLPRTAPSWVALLTSLPPLANGVETMFPTSKRAQLSELAMPAHLASLGYATSVTSEYAGEFFDRVALGFERRSVPRVELEQILGQALLGREPAALALAGQLYASATSLERLLSAPLPELLRGFSSFSDPRVLEADLFASISARPWFALLFYSQPHFPYTSSSPYYERYSVAGSDPALRFGKDVTRGDVRTDLDRAQIEALYRGALAETDAAVGNVLSRLESSGELADTIVILTADHGEGLYECPACVGHGDNLTGMMTLKVPLAFWLPRARFPRAAPVTMTSYVSQLDVYPTVLSLLGVPRPPVDEGIALLSADGAAAPLPEGRVFFAETGEWLWPTPAVPAERLEYPPITAMASVERDRIVIEEQFLPVIRAAKHRAALLPPWKLVYRPGRASVAWSLYDVERDPFEVHDLAAAMPAKMSELRSALVHSVLRFSQMIAVGDYFLTRPPPPPEEYY